MVIKFGTSGWRGIIADDFTFGNVRLAAQGIADYLREVHGNSVVIGYDTRFLSEEFAKTVAEVIAGNDIEVHFSRYDIPTPVISFEILDRELDGGINITASHNDYIYNGLKFSNSKGGPALPEETEKIEANIANNRGRKIKTLDFDEGVLKRNIKIFDKTNYLNNLRKLVDLEKIKEKHLNVVYEPFFATGRRYIPELIGDITDFTMIHGERDPLFGMMHPEPIEENLSPLKEAVLKNHAFIGISTDGDADRFGFIDKSGEFVPPNIILSIIYYYLIEVRNMKGNVVRTISTTSLLDRIAHFYGFDSIVTPVGFKYIGEALYEKKAIFGGEESGGASLSGWLQEKDGILVDTLMLEIVAHFGKTLTELKNDLFKKFGEVYNKRLDFPFEPILQNKAMPLLKIYLTKEKEHLSIKSIEEFDGLKVEFEDRSKAVFRVSGTEPKLRIYLESETENKLEDLVQITTDAFKKAVA